MTTTKPVKITVTEYYATLEQIAKTMALLDDNKVTPGEINSIMANLKKDNKKLLDRNLSILKGIGINGNANIGFFPRDEIKFSEKNVFWKKYLKFQKEDDLWSKCMKFFSNKKNSTSDEETGLRSKIVKAAQNMVGLSEPDFYKKYGNKLPKPLREEYGLFSYPAWCAGFVEMALMDAGIKLPFDTTKRITIDDLHALAVKKKCFTEIENPACLDLQLAAGKIKAGDIVLYHWPRADGIELYNHAAIVERVLPNRKFITLDGNAPMYKDKDGNVCVAQIDKNGNITNENGLYLGSMFADGVVRTPVETARYEHIIGVISADGLK